MGVSMPLQWILQKEYRISDRLVTLHHMVCDRSNNNDVVRLWVVYQGYATC